MRGNGQRFRRGGNIKTKFNGADVKCRADPSAVVTNPWNTLTCNFELEEGTGNISFLSSEQVQVYLTDTLGITLNSSTSLHIRVLEMRVWDLSGNPIQVQYQCLDSGADTIIHTSADEPGRNRWAHLGYIWPKDHQNYILLPENNRTIAYIRYTTGANIIVHLNILWKTSGVADITALDESHRQFKPRNYCVTKQSLLPDSKTSSDVSDINSLLTPMGDLSVA